MSGNIHILILAAGASTRLGRAKQMLPWRQTTLLGHAITTADASQASGLTVVLGAQGAKIRARLQAIPGEVITHPDWKAGMGSTIAYGMRHLLKKQERPEALLIMLCDQPMLGSAHLDRLISAFFKEGKGIVATAYENGAGVPAIFGNAYFQELAGIDGDTGARELLVKYKGDCLVITSGNPLSDIDTLRDYNELLRDNDGQ